MFLEQIWAWQQGVFHEKIEKKMTWEHSDFGRMNFFSQIMDMRAVSFERKTFSQNMDMRVEIFS